MNFTNQSPRPVSNEHIKRLKEMGAELEEMFDVKVWTVFLKPRRDIKEEKLFGLQFVFDNRGDTQ